MTATQFQAARKTLGLTQAAMAAALGINKRTVQRAETGEWAVSPRTERQVAQLLESKRNLA